MNFDPLSFVIGKHGDSGFVRDVVSYLIGRAVGAVVEVWKTITDVAVATFTTVSTSLRALVVDITPVQSGSGDPSPINVRPISGWSSVSLGQTPAGYVMPTIEQGGINIRGEEAISDTRCRSDYVLVSGITHIAFAVQGNARIVAIHSYDSDKNWISRTPYPDGKTSGSISLESGTVYLKFLFAKADTAANIVPSDIENLVVAPYSSISLGQTVYGGTLTDNGDGTWTLVKTMVGVDMGTMTWGASSQSGCFYTNSINDYKNVNNMVFYCSEYKPDGHGSTGDLYGIDNTIRYFLSESSGRAFNVHDNAQAGKTGEQFASAVSGVILVYELATPAAPITLTADSVKTLLGDNNIFADCGNINTITYRER